MTALLVIAAVIAASWLLTALLFPRDKNGWML